MLKWKTFAVGLVSVMAVGGVGTFAAGRMEAEDAPAKAAASKPVPGVDVPLANAAPVKIGDVLRVEVLEALPGRPITGQKIVRSDGTISLEFYGDVYVYGLNRKEIKVKVIEQLRKWLKDEVLGLENIPDPRFHPEKKVKIAPEDSDRVFVDEVLPEEFLGRADDAKLDKILRSLRKISDLSEHTLSRQQKIESRLRSNPEEPKQEPQTSSTAPANDAEISQRIHHYEKRLSDLERRLEHVIKSLESTKPNL